MPPKGSGGKKRAAPAAAASSSNPPAKKATTKKEKESSETMATEKSPKEHHFDVLDSVVQRVGGKGYTLEQGVPEGEDEEEEEEEGGEERAYTEEDMSHMRHIIITDRREKALTKYAKKILGDQFGDSFLMFNTSFSYQIFQEVPDEIKKIMRMKTPAERFDNLFALTKTLHRYDVWMNDYEDSDALKDLSKQLGAAWKKLLALSNEELGIDPEFTREGIEKLLEKFAEDLSEGPENIKFKWK